MDDERYRIEEPGLYREIGPAEALGLLAYLIAAMALVGAVFAAS